MSVKMEMKNDLVVCFIDGEIDINTSPDIKKTFDKFLSKKSPKILINLAKVNYIDSSGLATLVEILKNMRSYGGKMKLCNMSAKVKGLFEITKLDKLFDIVSDEASAVSAFI